MLNDNKVEQDAVHCRTGSLENLILNLQAKSRIVRTSGVQYEKAV